MNSYIFVNVAEVYKFKGKDSEINAAPLSLENVPKDYLDGNTKNTGLYGYVYDFSVAYDTIDVDQVLDIQKYLMKKHGIKCSDYLNRHFIALKCLDYLNRYFIALLSFSRSLATKYVFVNNEPCMIGLFLLI